jgi:transcriptional regulator with XRE-family HTH domain
MTPLRELATRIRQAFPDARQDYSEPATPGGVGFLDVSYRGSVLVVQWEEGHFGVTSPEGHGYGEKPDEVYRNADETANRIIALLQSGGKTQAPLEVTLRELRIERKLPQKGLADRLGISQPAVSKYENRVSRMMISSLRAVVQAMGGSLIIQVSFPGGVLRQIALDEDSDTQSESDDVVASG